MKQDKKKIAFVHGRPALSSAKLQYMPFGFNVVKKLAEGNYEIDLYLTQSQTNVYKNCLPSNVKIIFLDNKFVWSYGSGRLLYFLLNSYFLLLTMFKSYQMVWGIGQCGSVLGAKLAKRNNAKFIYLNDEFPDISYLKIWIGKEKKYATKAGCFIVPDESRVAPLVKQIPELKNIKSFVLPNIPLVKDVESMENTDWFKVLGLPKDKKIITYAGGIDRENNINYLLTVFPFTPLDYVLVMVGNGEKYKNTKFFSCNRILWIERILTDDELHSLIKQSLCCLCFYSDILDLEFVGKSSGKMMRSILLNIPVITTNFPSLKFIEEDGMGVLIEKPFQLIEAINKIDANKEKYQVAIKNNISKYTFEKYWQNIEVYLHDIIPQRRSSVNILYIK